MGNSSLGVGRRSRLGTGRRLFFKGLCNWIGVQHTIKSIVKQCINFLFHFFHTQPITLNEDARGHRRIYLL